MLSKAMQLHEHCELPEVQSLTLSHPKGDMLGLCSRFPTLSALAIHETKRSGPPDLIMNVLRAGVGQRLHTLVLDEAPHPMSLNKILQLCPKLKRLRLDFCNFNDRTVVWPESLLNSLEEVHLCNQYQAPSGYMLQVYPTSSVNNLVDKIKRES